MKALGADSFIFKSLPLTLIQDRLREIVAERPVFPEVIALDVQDAAPMAAASSTLTTAQARMLAAATGKLNKQIAYQMNLAEPTIQAHMSAIFKKLGVNNSTHAILKLEGRGRAALIRRSPTSKGRRSGFGPLRRRLTCPRGPGPDWIQGRVENSPHSRQCLLQAGSFVAPVLEQVVRLMAAGRPRDLSMLGINPPRRATPRSGFRPVPAPRFPVSAALQPVFSPPRFSFQPVRRQALRHIKGAL